MTDPADTAVISAQLGRPARGVVAIAHRCPCGHPDVAETAPRLPEGTPFPTTYYLTCPRLAGLIGTLEGGGAMRAMQDRLADDPELAARYRAAHEDYLRRRAELGEVPEIDGVSAGGMPGRVKCLHSLVGHALAAGPGLAAAVSYYGPAPDPAEAPKLSVPLMLHYAGKDARVAQTGVPWVAALKAAGKPVEAFDYPGVDHAFNNDTSAERYDKAAADLAWGRTIGFFHTHLDARA